LDGPPTSSRALLFLTIAAAGLTADLITKEWIFRQLGAPGTSHASGIWWLWEGYVGFQTALNRGALFGIGQGRVAWFAGLSVAAICGILYWFFVRGAWRDLWLTVTLGCILGGILGNLYDRLGLWTAKGLEGPTYAVRDWILLTYRQYVWPNFNIADSLLVCGAAMLIWHSFRAEVDDPHTKRSTPEG
jgi:signal peptidase II